MRRFFIEGLEEGLDTVELTGGEFIHLKKVLRLSPGDDAAVFNGRGLEALGVIEEIGRDRAVIRVKGRSFMKNESGLEITLLQGLAKGGKPEIIIEKATELGVKEVMFYASSRTVPVIKKGQEEGKLLRWRRAAVEAAKQCGRTVLPRIGFSPDFKSASSGRGFTLRLVFLESGEKRRLKDVLRSGAFKSAAILVGPEGGISDEEAREAVSNGFIPVGLGPRILRTETAAITALSIIQYELGDMG